MIPLKDVLLFLPKPFEYGSGVLKLANISSFESKVLKYLKLHCPRPLSKHFIHQMLQVCLISRTTQHGKQYELEPHQVQAFKEELASKVSEMIAISKGEKDPPLSKHFQPVFKEGPN